MAGLPVLRCKPAAPAAVLGCVHGSRAGPLDGLGLRVAPRDGLLLRAGKLYSGAPDAASQLRDQVRHVHKAALEGELRIVRGLVSPLCRRAQVYH